MKFTHLLLGCALSIPFFSDGAELSIPEERSFTGPVPFPAASLPTGRIHKPAAPEWKSRSLDGKWKLRTVPFVKGRTGNANDEGIQQKLFRPEISTANWEDITVPSSWYLTPRYDTSSGKIGYYRRSFDLAPEEVRQGRIILDFRRVAERADVWVNGKSAGEAHIGRGVSFQYDITDLVKAGRNELAVRVYDYLGHTSYWRRHIGGIHDSVRLLLVPSTFFVPRAMITPDLKNNTIYVQLQTISPGELRGFTAEIVHWKDGRKVASRTFKDFRIPAGTKWHELGTIPLPSPRLWSPEDPHLYVLRIRDGAGKIAGFERFGFREFKTQGEWFLLNGKKFKPRMHTFSIQSTPALHNNLEQGTEKALRLMKERLHVNMIRPHSGEGTPLETLYNICDEIGMLVYFDWSGPGSFPAYDKEWNDCILESAPEFEEFIRDNYSRPSIVMWSFGNEIYEGHHNLFFSRNLDKLYTMVKKLDLQNRPICSSTGRQTLEAMQAGLLKERTDVADDHQYRGSYCGSWQENIEHINRYAEVANRYFKHPLPKVDAEYGVPGDCARYRGATTVKSIVDVLKMPRTTAAFKEAYAKMLQDPRAEVGGYLRFKSNFATPDDYIAKKPIYRKFAFRYLKRPMEIYRRAGVKCLGGHTNAQWYDLFRDFPDGYQISDVPQSLVSAWSVTPAFYETARCYNPTLVSAGVFNQQPYAGKSVDVELFVTNDLNEDAVFEVVPQLRLESGTVRTFPAQKFGKIPAMEQKSLRFRFNTPDTGKIERGYLELYLFKNGKRVGDNYYDVSIFPARKTALPAKCALYDSAGIKFRGLLKTPTTLSTLKKLGGKFTAIRDFKDLDSFTHLILGTNSFDKTVLESGDRIFKWVENGGKLLVLEQSLCGKVPFLANYSIVSGNPGTLVTLVDPSHPVFRNLRQDDMDSWFGDLGRMSRCAIGPMDAGMVAVMPLAASLDPDCYKSVLCDVKIGKGEVILSQIAASDRIRESGAAGEYLTSLLEYFTAPGVSKYALPIPNAQAGKVLYLEEKDAFFVDLSQAVNRSFSDDKAGDGKDGWTDFGASNDMRNIPCGKITRLQGGVPFRILNPAENNGRSCIVLKGKERSGFPKRVTGIPVNALLNAVYVLHTAMYAREPGIAVRYILRYEDGSSKEFTADTRYDLPDWWQAQDKRNAKVVYRDGQKSLFVSEFINPHPNRKIVSIDIVSEGVAIPVVIAITGRQRLSSVVSGVGEK